MFDLLGQGCHVQLYRFYTAQRCLAKEAGGSEILLLRLSCHQTVLPGVTLHEPKGRGASIDSHRGDTLSRRSCVCACTHAQGVQRHLCSPFQLLAGMQGPIS